MAASRNNAPGGSITSLNDYGSGQISVFTNTLSQIRHRSASDVAIYINTLGWEDSL
jgi:hypothetical protein